MHHQHQHAPAASAVAQAQPDYYVPLPRPMLRELRDTPGAVGLYALIARVYRATGAPVPLSAADVHRYDPSTSPHAAARALARLRQSGYLEVVSGAGRRGMYRPTWGTINGQSRPWELGAPSLNRPRHVYDVRLPQGLLDTYLGRLEPHALRGAHVARYTTEPLLGLIDVGAYALTMAGYPTSTNTLAQQELLRDGLVLPLPSVTTILALASQRRLLDAESPIALTAAGWRRLGITVGITTGTSSHGEPLVFVPTELRGTLSGTYSGNLSGYADEQQLRFSASPRPRGRVVPASPTSQGIRSKEGVEESPTRLGTCSGGSGVKKNLQQPDMPAVTVQRATFSTPNADTTAAPGPVERLLLQIGVRRDVARTLRERPLEQVEQVIADARTRTDVRSLAGWVVSALREQPAVTAPMKPLPKVSETEILFHPGLSGSERQRWLARFHKSIPAERPAILARMYIEHPITEEHPHAAAA